MNRAITLVAALAAFTSTGAARAQPAKSNVLLVLSKGDLTLSVVDPATMTVLGRVPSGPGSARGRRVRRWADRRTSPITTAA